MSATIRRLSFISLLVLLPCCSSSGGQGGDQQNQGQTPPTQGFSPGCSQAPACGSCQSCSEQCFCATQDIVTCANICSNPMSAAGASNPGGGYPGAGGVGAAGSTSVGAGGYTAGGAGTPPVGAGGFVAGAGGAPPVGAGGFNPSAGGSAPAGGGGATAGAGGATTVPQTSEFDITTSQFVVPPGGEVFKCQNFRNTVAQDVAILYSDSFMSAGSHHMFVFHDPTYNADSNAVADCLGIEFHDFIHEAQTPQRTWKYPDGVGRFLKGTDGMRLLVHYLNTTSSSLNGQVTVKFHYVQPSQVTFLAAEMFLNVIGIAVTPGTSTTARSYRVPYDVNFIQVVSHMHKQGVHFTASTTAGQTLYDGTKWDEPTPNYFDPPLLVTGGTTVNYACTYNNTTGVTLTFGESAATNEMCIFVGCFYPTNPAANQGVSINVQSP